MSVPDLEYHLDQVAGVVGTVATPGLELWPGRDEAQGDNEGQLTLLILLWPGISTQ